MAKKTPSKVGRPEKVNDEIIRKLEDAFSIGATVLEACCHADIPKSTYYDYLNKNPAFSDRIELLKEKMPLKARAVINSDLDAGDSQTARWLLERNKRHEFSTQQNIEHKAEVEVSNADDLKKYSQEDLEVMMAIKAKYKGGEDE